MSPTRTLFLMALAVAALIGAASAAWAGPPFLSDDPAPTDYRHFEIYGFATGGLSGDPDGAVGIDFNYGATPDLQLTATMPLAYTRPTGGPVEHGVTNIELAAKVRLLHQETFGLDVAVFPRVFLPSASRLGEDHAGLLVPVWVGRSGENWSTFGGGGCAINRGGESMNYCIAGWAVTRRVHPSLQLGAEVFHQTADIRGGRNSSTLGIGGIYDVNENLHLLGYVGAGLQNTAETGRGVWYVSALFTF